MIVRNVCDVCMVQHCNYFQSTIVVRRNLDICYPYFFLKKIFSNVFILTGTHSHKYNPYNPTADWKIYPNDEIAAAYSLWCHGVPQSSLRLLPVYSLHVLWGKVSMGMQFFSIIVVYFFFCACSIETKVTDFQCVTGARLKLFTLEYNILILVNKRAKNTKALLIITSISVSCSCRKPTTCIQH